jgi:hypothetical protein
MANPMQPDPGHLQVALDNGEVVELDGGTLMLGEEESPSVLLRLAPWRARSVARVLEEWSAVSRVFHRAPRPILTELELSRTLDLAASALADPEPAMPMLRGDRVVPSRQRLDAVAVLANAKPGSPRCNGWHWSTQQRHGCPSPTAGSSWRMHCWGRRA